MVPPRRTVWKKPINLPESIRFFLQKIEGIIRMEQELQASGSLAPELLQKGQANRV